MVTLSIRARYLGPFGQHSGYSQAINDYLMSLLAAGVELDIDPVPAEFNNNLPKRYMELFHHVGTGLDPTHYIIHTPPQFAHEFAWDDYAPSPNIPRVCNTTWETTKLPAGTRESLDTAFDLIVAPSNFVKAAIGLDDITTVVPHAFDPGWLQPLPKRPAQPYTFYSILTWCERKNPIGLLKAYLTTFSNVDDVLLKIVTPHYSVEDVEALKVGIGLQQLPPVEFITKRLSDDEMFHLHATTDCYVTVTRGEGWGLGAFEAALVGNPVIAPSFSGLTDFLDEYLYKHYIPWHLTPVVTPEPKLTAPIEFAGRTINPVESPAPLGLSADQSWAEPDLATCRRIMRQAYKERWQKWSLAANRIKELFNYEVVGQQFVNALEVY